MAIIIKTIEPTELLYAIKLAIEEKRVQTWSVDTDGDFKYTGESIKGWLRPEIYNGELRFGLLGLEGVDITTYEYAVNHGRFIEMLLLYFDDRFTKAYASAHKIDPDYY